ncbi:MAG: SMP-30/gluconolactonase/LRE family protein [Saprospiraceae bacterium]|nr:SMP-30/gluconolactonase/LRE family protein [Saprospiraceae bacterium]
MLFISAISNIKAKKFNSPNDLFIKKDGDIFFTDPPYGLPGQDQDSIKELSFNGIFRLKNDGTVTLLDSTLSKPNGITFSADEKFMYVANSDPRKALWRKYTLLTNKKYCIDQFVCRCHPSGIHF